jgi:hypothetical protein
MSRGATGPASIVRVPVPDLCALWAETATAISDQIGAYGSGPFPQHSRTCARHVAYRCDRRTAALDGA